MRIYEKVHLVVATPGRILDLMEKKVTFSSHVPSVVVDLNTTFCVFKKGLPRMEGLLLKIKDKAKQKSKTHKSENLDPDPHSSSN